LNDIKTTNPEYLEEIKRMKVLNDIVSQPKIDAAFEDHLMKDYAEYFVEKEVKKDTAMSTVIMTIMEMHLPPLIS
jgi:hypothetical protein